MRASYFSLKRRVAYYETDAMAVVHHSNYLRFLEESRVSWYNEKKLYDLDWGGGRKHDPQDQAEEAVMAVIESGLKHKSPLRFNDEFEVRMQVKLEGIKIQFQYAIMHVVDSRLAASGFTIHIPVNQKLKIVKVPASLEAIMKEESWTETWP